nr:TIGR04211 family SH3 domain-containing protein [Oceanobacter mangrovi]
MFQYAGLALVLGFGFSPAQAEESTIIGLDDPSYVASSSVSKRYVTDTLWLQLRSGPSAEYRILQALQTGEHLMMLGENKDAGYTLVRTDKGKEGWVLTRYLETSPVAREQLILTQRDLQAKDAELKTATQRVAELEAELKKLRSERSQLEQQAEKTTSELADIKEVSSNALALDEKVHKLTNRAQELEIQLEATSTENAQLRDSRDFNYLLYGGGLVVLGIIAGLIIPSLRSKKNTGWS